MVSQSDMAIQTTAALDELDDDQEDYDEEYDGNRQQQQQQFQELQQQQLQQLLVAAGDLRRRSISLNDILGSSFVHESANGERIIISRGWPAPAYRRRSRRKSRSLSARRRVSLTVRRPSASNVALHTIDRSSNNDNNGNTNRRNNAQRLQIQPNLTGATGGASRQPLNEEQKRRLLVEYLRSAPNEEFDNQQQYIMSSELDVDSALRMHQSPASNSRRRSVTILKTSARHHNNYSGNTAKREPGKQVSKSNERLADGLGNGGKLLKKPTMVHYDLPVHSSGPIAMGNAG